MNPNVHAVTSKTFDDEVLSAKTPVLVDFTATWCGPCKALARVVDQFANEQQGRVKVVTVDIDDAPDIAARYGVRAVPTVIAFSGGTKIAQRLGLTTKDKLAELFSSATSLRA
jgi:thioredoxin 1